MTLCGTTLREGGLRVGIGWAGTRIIYGLGWSGGWVGWAVRIGSVGGLNAMGMGRAEAWPEWELHPIQETLINKTILESLAGARR